MERKRPALWMRLDNAAKLYASVSSKRDPKVFRFVCQLTEEINPAYLQTAVEQSLDLFPLYRSVLRRGLFWYFLEPSGLCPSVREEDRPPCQRLYDRVSRGLLFDVTYFRNRINLEVYHVLTDGTGALQFLRTLVTHYLYLAHPEAFGDTPPALDYGASETERSGDSFHKYYTGKSVSEKASRRVPAAHFRGMRLPENHFRVIGGEMDAAALRACASRYHTSLTHLLCALLMQAIAQELPVRERRKPVVLTIPVNLRNYFESESARNFFSIFHVSYRFDGGAELPQILDAVRDSFARELTEENIAAQMNRMAAIENNYLTRAIPLVLKDIALAFANRFSERCVTGGFSNMGRVTMPETCTPFIEGFDVFMCSDRIQLCAISYGGRLLLSVTAPYVSTDVQKRFFRALAAEGIDIIINANDGE